MKRPENPILVRLRAIAGLQPPGPRQIDNHKYGYGPIGDAEHDRRRAKAYNRRKYLEKNSKVAA